MTDDNGVRMTDDKRERFHPGEYIKDEMEARGWSNETMGERSQLGRDLLEEILSGHRRVTRLTALCLANAFGTTNQVWLNLQKQFDEQE